MPEQDGNRGGRWRVICPHGKPKTHCQGRLIHIRVIRKRALPSAPAAPRSPIGVRHAQ